MSSITTRTTSRTTLLLTTGAVTALLLAGCGSSSPATQAASGTSTSSPRSSASYGPAATGPHNAADVRFSTDMLPHHAQAVEMADMALSRNTNSQVQALAQQIKAAQAPEIATMSGWLNGWGATVPTSMGHSSHDTAGMSGMGGGDGMMSGADMTALDAASGTQFAKLWLTGMIKHHMGAVAMAKTELTSGQNDQAKALANSIVTSQSTEIKVMSTLLSTLA